MVKMALPMPNGVFASSFKLVAKLLEENRLIDEAVKSGNFPQLIAERESLGKKR